MAEKNTAQKVVEKEIRKSIWQKIAHAVGWIDAPADITMIGLLLYLIVGKGGSVLGGQKSDSPVELGLADEAGFLDLCTTLEAIGGTYGRDCAKAIQAIHAAFDLKESAQFRALLLGEIKELRVYFEKLRNVPKSKSNKDQQLKAYLLSLNDGPLTKSIELYRRVQSARTRTGKPGMISLSEAAAHVAEEIIRDHELPGTFAGRAQAAARDNLEKIELLISPWEDKSSNWLKEKKGFLLQHWKWITFGLLSYFLILVVIIATSNVNQDRWKPKSTEYTTIFDKAEKTLKEYAKTGE